MKILLAAAEATPFIKTGGLGDVIGALPKALHQQQDVEVRVILPYYKKVAEKYGQQVTDVFKLVGVGNMLALNR